MRAHAIGCACCACCVLCALQRVHLRLSLAASVHMAHEHTHPSSTHPTTSHATRHGASGEGGAGGADRAPDALSAHLRARSSPRPLRRAPVRAPWVREDGAGRGGGGADAAELHQRQGPGAPQQVHRRVGAGGARCVCARRRRQALHPLLR
eukprot:2903843-Rhodomonas_salina.1